MKKRILSMLLVIVLVLSVLPVQALAEGGWAIVSDKPGSKLYTNGEYVTLSLADGEGNPITTGIIWGVWDGLTRDTSVEATKCKVTGKTQGSTAVTATHNGEEKKMTFTVYQTPDSLTIVDKATNAAPAAKLEKGDTLDLTYAYTSATAIKADLITTDWSITGSTGVLEVTPEGKVTAVGYGAATVQLMMNGKTATHTITVNDPNPGEITIEKSASSMLKDKTVTLSAAIEGRTDLKGNTFDWSFVAEESTGEVSFAPSATDNTCVVTGTKAGSVTIKVKRQMNSKWYEKTEILTVESNDLTIKTAGDKDSILVGEELQFTAYDAKGQALEGVGWNSRNEGVAKFDSANPNTLIGVSEGTAKIYAVKSGYAVTEVTITVGANNINIVKADDAENKPLTSPISIYVDQVLKLKAVDKNGKVLDVNWYNADSNTNVTVVNGNLTGVTPTAGDATVKIKAVNRTYGNDAFLDVKVLPKSSFIKLRLDDPDVRPTDLAVGETRTLMALKDTSGVPVEGVKWDITSGSENAELVGENRDQLKGLKDGKVVLTATCVGFDSMQVTIYVKTELLESVEIPGFPKEMNEGQEIVLSEILESAQFTPTYATDKTISFTSCNKEDPTKNDIVAIVDGKLVAKKFGTAIVTGTYVGTADSKPLTFEVKVKAAKQIQLDSTMPLELICGEAMDLKAVLMDAEGNTLETPVQWRLKDNKVIKNLVDLTANRLTAYPQSTYGFDVELEAFVDDTQVEVLPVTIHVIPRTVNIALKKGEEDVTDKTAVLDVKNTDGITIQAEIKPDDARQIVSWQVKDPNGICQYTPSDNAVVIKPISSLKTGTVTVIATAADGTSKTAQTTVQIAKMAETLEILDLKDAPEVNYLRGGETLRLRTSFDNDKTLTDRGIKWEVTGEGKAYASISEDGVLDIAAVSERTTITVTATAKANAAATDSKEITLCPSVKSIKIVRKDGDTLRNVMDYTSDEIELGIEVNPEDGYIDSFVWDSSNKAVAEVDSDGVLTLQGVAGKTQITCTADDGSKVRGIYNLEVVMAAGYVDIEGVEELVSGKSATLKATVYSDDEILAGNQRVIWSVEDVFGNATKAASINSRGRLVAKTVNYGTEVVVYAKSVENGEVIGEHHVTILPKKARTFMAAREGEDGTEILGSTLYMNAGESTVIFGQWFTREDGLYDEYDCTYFSSNSGVAKIYEDGALETLKKGSATITVRATDPDTRNVYTAKFTLKVINTVDHIVISKPDKAADYVRSGERMNLSATVWSNEVETIKADNEGVTWSVFEENGTGLVETGAAYMTSGGTIVANSVTKNTPVVVVATSKENSSIIGEFPLTIRPAKAYTVTARCENEAGDWVVPSAAVSLEAKSGNTYFTDEIRTNVYVSNPNSGYDGKDLPGAAIVWETSNKDIVKVVDGKLVYTGRTGKVKVTPTFKADNVTYRGNTITLNIVKYVKAGGVTVTKKYANQELYSGKSLVMYANVDKDATIRRVSWSLVGSDDGDVASINASTGLIRARKGLTERYTITVMATAVDGSGVSDTMEVTIYPLTTRVEIITEDDITALEKGETAELTAVLLVGGEEDQANQNAVKWRSSRSSVVYVDKDGNITAKRKGTATIKASATDGSGKYATIKVTVK